jgi:hypothetical protein
MDGQAPAPPQSRQQEAQSPPRPPKAVTQAAGRGRNSRRQWHARIEFINSRRKGESGPARRGVQPAVAGSDSTRGAGPGSARSSWALEVFHA